MDGNKLLSHVGGARGAPMGRPTIQEDPAAKCRLFKVRFIDGCYDIGGAYWGGPADLYCATGAGFQTFTRAKNRAAARSQILERFPELTFYR